MLLADAATQLGSDEEEAGAKLERAHVHACASLEGQAKTEWALSMNIAQAAPSNQTSTCLACQRPSVSRALLRRVVNTCTPTLPLARSWPATPARRRRQMPRARR